MTYLCVAFDTLTVVAMEHLSNYTGYMLHCTVRNLSRNLGKIQTNLKKSNTPEFRAPGFNLCVFGMTGFWKIP